MSSYLLDTNICIYYLKGLYGLDKRIAAVGKENCFVSSVTFAELFYGVENSNRQEKNRAVIRDFVGEFEVIPFEVAIEEFARQKVHLKAIGRIVGDFDILIGSTAIAKDLILVTRNVKDFINMKGIRIENWILD